jgi:hypothetical protein
MVKSGSYVSGIKPDLQSTYSLTSCDLVSHLISADQDAGDIVEVTKWSDRAVVGSPRSS